MSHILLGTNDDDYVAILDAAQDGKDIPAWVVPKKAKPGESALLFVRAHGFVAGARIGDGALSSGYFGNRPVYRGGLTDISLLPIPVSLAHIAHEMPDWDWTRYPRTFTTIDRARFDDLWKILLAFQGDLPTSNVPKPYQETLLEGQARRAMAVRYERNARARLLCIQHHGTSCAVCGFDFGAVYGEAFEGFIVVHHLEPLSAKDGEYVVDPVRDMRPVCANCHLVIHRRAPPYSIEEVTEMLPEGWFDNAGGEADGDENEAGENASGSDGG